MDRSDDQRIHIYNKHVKSTAELCHDVEKYLKLKTFDRII